MYERPQIDPHHPTSRIHRMGRPLVCPFEQWNCYHPDSFRPDKRIALISVVIAHPNDLSVVVYAKSDRRISALERADTECRVSRCVVNNPDPGELVARSNAPAHDPARIVDAVCGGKVTSIRRCRRDDGGAAHSVDYAAP